jgi:hypothetical protein
MTEFFTAERDDDTAKQADEDGSIDTFPGDEQGTGIRGRGSN